MGKTDDAISQRTLITMGAYVIIMPDKKYINTIPKKDDDGNDVYDYGDIEARIKSSSSTFTICKSDGSDYDNVTVQAKEPESPNNMDLWLDVSTTPNVLKQYSEYQEKWVSVPTTYVKIYFTDDSLASDTFHKYHLPFEVGDGITISGITNEKLLDFNSSMVMVAKGIAKEDTIIKQYPYIVVKGVVDKIYKLEQEITVERKMPNMDYVFECENRLWGCRYGEALNGEMVNEIYASKLGDFKNWNVSTSISTDSWVSQVGSDGPFTAAIAHSGYPLFFKENCLHKVYGEYPSNYQIQTTACRGVQNGCHKSLAIVNEILYYKSRGSICSYDGSLPQEISYALGDIQYYNAVAGAIGNKYYVSMSDSVDLSETGKYSLFVCDTAKGLWHKEDNTNAVDFCTFNGDLYYLDDAYNEVKTVKGTAGTVESTSIPWEATTGIIGINTPDNKYISRLIIRMSLDFGSIVSVFADYDSSGNWEHILTMDGTNLRSFPVPIKPKRCDHMRLKFTGSGSAKIFSICKTIEQGSDG